jgi:phenylacetate-CoA ligase
MNAIVAIEDLLHPLLGDYYAAPGWLRASAGRAYACLPRVVRLGGAYNDFREVFPRTADASSAAEYAHERLGETLGWALRTLRGLVARGRDPRDVLADLPVTDKLDIKRDPEAWLSTAMHASARMPTFTGGSTRTPMSFFLQKHVTRPRDYAFMAELRGRLGARDGDRVLALRGRTIPSAAMPGGATWMYEPIKRQLVMSTDHLSRRFLPACAEALMRYQPTLIEAFPSALYPLARWLEAHPLPAFVSGVRGIALFSENVYGFQMDLFRRVFGCPVVAHYGHSERVLMAATMPDDDRYFVWPQYGWLELMDSRDRPITQPGRLGFVVGTSFDNHVMPFVRYRTGDLAMLGEGEHPALPGYPVLERIAGRLQELIACRDGRLISVTALGVAHFAELAGLEAIQYEQREAGKLVLRVVADFPVPSRQARRIAEAVEAKTQGGCEVHVEQAERIERTPRGKARMLVQHLDLRRHLDAALES